MSLYVLGGTVAVVLVGWYAVAMAWASSVAKHQPDLGDAVHQIRYGWKCKRCGRVHAPACRVSKCGGPLVWVQKGTRIKCARCHTYLVAHPMLFRQTPRPRRMLCRYCKWIGVVKDWKVS